MNSFTSWDSNQQQFLIESKEGDIDISGLEFGVAANITYAWRTAHAWLDERANGRPLFITDFGCGSGAFSEQRDDRDDVVTAIDRSAAMISAARSGISKQIYCFQGEEDALRLVCHQDAVVANLVTNYLEELDDLAKNVTKALNPGGVFIFAELNPEYVSTCLQRGMIYSDPDPVDKPRHATLNFSGGAKKITLWEHDEYVNVLNQYGLDFRKMVKPLLSPEFIEKFKHEIPDGYPEDLPRYRIYLFEKRS